MNKLSNNNTENNSVYSIKDLEHLTGIKAHTIRVWEQRYGLIEPQRTDSNIRYYSSEDLKHMLNISLLNNNGYKISKIAQMSKEEVCEKVLQTIDKNSSFNDQINAMTLSMIDLNEDQFEKVMSTNIVQYGFESTIINIVYPFLTKIGFLWQTDAINPAQEHFITNLIRQKLIVAIDSQGLSADYKTKKRYMLFLPEGEMHELSLLFASYLVKARGNKVYYLGQSMPLANAYEAYKLHKPDVILSIITSYPDQETIQPYIDELAERFNEASILLSGYQVVGQDLKTPKNVIILTHINFLIQFIEENNQSVSKLVEKEKRVLVYR